MRWKSAIFIVSVCVDPPVRETAVRLASTSPPTPDRIGHPRPQIHVSQLILITKTLRSSKKASASRDALNNYETNHTVLVTILLQREGCRFPSTPQIHVQHLRGTAETNIYEKRL